MPDHVGDRGAVRLDPGASRLPTYRPDEHAQTSVPEHGDHSPRLAGGPDGAEAARRVARAGRAAICRQNPPSRGHGTEGPCLGAASLHPGHLLGTGPRTGNQEGSRSPATEQPGIRGLRIGLPARRWRLRDACGLSRLNDFLPLWSQAYMPSCNRQVTSTSIHMAEPGPAAAPRGHAPL
jgi:hypothetical protein